MMKMGSHRSLRMNPPLFDCALSLATVFPDARRQNPSSQALEKVFDLFVGWMVRRWIKKSPWMTPGRQQRIG
jgi:hypothetical protein